MQTHQYVYAISTDNIRAAIVQAEDALSDLLEGILATSQNEAELQLSVEMLRLLARRREQLSYADAASSGTEDYDDGDSSSEIVE